MKRFALSLLFFVALTTVFTTVVSAESTSVPIEVNVVNNGSYYSYEFVGTVNANELVLNYGNQTIVLTSTSVITLSQANFTSTNFVAISGFVSYMTIIEPGIQILGSTLCEFHYLGQPFRILLPVTLR